MAAKGYPGDYVKGTEIKGLAQNFGEDVEIFHAGTALKNGKLLANGGRVLNVTAFGKTAKDAQIKAYAVIDKIDWPDGFCRKDIGWRAIDW
jgi:phosphoribosylamine--glycine ligase